MGSEDSESTRAVMGLYVFLDKFFFVFHTIIVLFILFGWLWKKTRLAHLIVTGLVAGSWFFLGIWFGIGYCPFTEWHWRIRLGLGYTDMSRSYVHFLIVTLTGLEVSERSVDIGLIIGLAVSTAGSVTLFSRDVLKKRKQR
jgi:hypothetical protein